MTRYQIQIRGHLDRRWEAMFPEFRITHQLLRADEPITLMTGEVSDQAALYGLIGRLRNMGLELISVQPQASKEKPDEEK